MQHIPHKCPCGVNTAKTMQSEYFSQQRQTFASPALAVGPHSPSKNHTEYRSKRVLRMRIGMNGKPAGLTTRIPNR